MFITIIKGSSAQRCDNLGGWDGGGRAKREGIHVYIYDSLHCTAETNTTL